MNLLELTNGKTVKALSWKEPYGSLMIHGKVETRSWPTNYRGWVLICTSQKGYTLEQISDISGHQISRISRIVSRMKYGQAIAIGRLVDCRPMRPEDEDKCFVDFYPDLFCHVYEDVQAIEPFPWKGSLGFRDVNNDYLTRMKIKP